VVVYSACAAAQGLYFMLGLDHLLGWERRVGVGRNHGTVQGHLAATPGATAEAAGHLTTAEAVLCIGIRC
jgi:hypothetical protein